MSRSLTASDRSALIKLASSLPAGSSERKAILAGLVQTQKSSGASRGLLAGTLRDRNFFVEYARRAKFVFRNKALEDLWVEEFVGQISDGMWESVVGSGWQFWSELPTSVGSQTQLVGIVPPGVKQTFAFNRLIPIVGDDMLKIIQKTEPEATMQTVKAYTREIMKALSENKF